MSTRSTSPLHELHRAATMDIEHPTLTMPSTSDVTTIQALSPPASSTSLRVPSPSESRRKSSSSTSSISDSTTRASSQKRGRKFSERKPVPQFHSSEEDLPRTSISSSSSNGRQSPLPPTTTPGAQEYSTHSSRSQLFFDPSALTPPSSRPVSSSRKPIIIPSRMTSLPAQQHVLIPDAPLDMTELETRHHNQTHSTPTASRPPTLVTSSSRSSSGDASPDSSLTPTLPSPYRPTHATGAHYRTHLAPTVQPIRDVSSSSARRQASSWSALEELELAEEREFDALVGAGGDGKGKKESRREKKARKVYEEEIFTSGPGRLPTAKELFDVSQLEVSTEDGEKVKFGDIVKGGAGRKTIVIFIRHWYCPLCAEYMESIIRTVSRECLEEANVDIAIIGNGSSKMVTGYRKIFKCPFTVYTDTKLRVYRGLGMTRQTTDAGPEEEKGDYITKSMLKGTIDVVKNAGKMPIRKFGAVNQLGGEFIFSSTLQCIYANRMTTTRNHASIRDIASLAGVNIGHSEPRGASPPPIHRASPGGAENDDFAFGNWGENGLNITHEERAVMEERRESNGEGWKVERENELERIRNDRAERREAMKSLGLSACAAEEGESEEEEGEGQGEEGQGEGEKVRIVGLDEVSEVGTEVEVDIGGQVATSQGNVKAVLHDHVPVGLERIAV